MPKWLSADAPESDVVVSTRVRLARNLSDVPFPSRIRKESEIERVHEGARDALLVSPQFAYFKMEDIPELPKRALAERYIISPELMKTRFGGLIKNGDESLSVMILEEDHYRLQSLASGLSLESAYEQADRLDNLLAAGVRYAFDEKLGFLTSCPTNVGTGLRASLMLHLPGLTAAKGIQRMAGMIGKLGMTVRGAFGEGSAAAGAFYQISNQVTLGVSEKEILARLMATARKVIDFERGTRKELHGSLGLVLEDKVWRSIGVLKYARRMGDAEAQKLISDVAFGVSLGIVPGLSSSALYEVMMNTRPAVIAEQYGCPQPLARDTVRADILRKVFSV